MWGVYVHIPWCRIRCPYCAFNVYAPAQPPHHAYTEALLREWALRAPLFSGRPETVFFGGGTPSLTPAPELARLIAALDPVGEVSMEANPEDVDAEKVAAWIDSGVNRLSLGVQSFHPAVGRRLGRTRTARAGQQALVHARRVRSVSVDLIFGLPDQTIAMLNEDIDRAVDGGVDHLSLYGLTIEAGTPFHRAGMGIADDDAWRELYDSAVARLEAAGLHRYEVSNFARPGHRCVHNEHYWRARPWAGLGAGAHAWWPDQRRAHNVNDPDAYLRAADPVDDLPEVDPDALAVELVWSTLRHIEGLDRAQLRALTGRDVLVPPDLIAHGLLREEGEKVLLQADGFPLADAITARLGQALGLALCS